MTVSGRVYMVTAAHVLTQYLNAQSGDIPHLMQAGGSRFWPEDRPCWYDESIDVAFIESTLDEAASLGVCVVDLNAPWRPVKPANGGLVAFSGFPGVTREHPTFSEANHNALSAVLTVTSSGEDYLICQLEHSELMSFFGAGIPEPGTPLGGMSGAPVFDMRAPGRPLVGIVYQHHEGFDLLRIRTLDALPRRLDFRRVG